MLSYLKKIAPAAALTLIAGALVAYAATNAIETPIALFSTSLASKITTTQATMTLVSGATLDGTTLASSTYSFIIDEGTASQEFVKADCTNTTCTNMQRGLSGITGTSTVAALEFLHLRGASVKITDAPYLLNLHSILTGQGGSFPFNLSYSSSTMLTASSSTQIPPASWVYNNFVRSTENTTVNSTTTAGVGHGFIQTLAPTNASDLANKAYVDAISVAGAPNADTVTKGIVEEATVAEINASTTVGGTGAQLFINPSILANSTYASSTIAATTSVQVLATSTLSSFPLQDNFNFLIHASTTNVISTGTAVASTQSTPICLFFNAYSPSPDSYTYTSTEIRGTTLASETSSGSNKICLTPSGATLAYKEIHITGSVMNLPNFWKYGTILAQYRGQTDVDAHSTTYFAWQSTAQVNTISLSTSSTTQGFGSSTYMSIVK